MREDYGRDYPPRINTTKKRTSSGFVSLKKIENENQERLQLQQALVPNLIIYSRNHPI